MDLLRKILAQELELHEEAAGWTPKGPDRCGLYEIFLQEPVEEYVVSVCGNTCTKKGPLYVRFEVETCELVDNSSDVNDKLPIIENFDLSDGMFIGALWRLIKVCPTE